MCHFLMLVNGVANASFLEFSWAKTRFPCYQRLQDII